MDRGCACSRCGAQAMSGHRQAALALHALGSEDRRLVLAELPEADQAALHHYLEELRSLGFTGDAVKTALAPAATDLASAAPADVFALLEQEPSLLVAQVLQARAWDWRDAVLAMYRPARRQAILAARPMAAPSRTRFLLESLGTALQQRAALPSAAQRPVANPFMRWMKTWRR